VYTVLKIDEVSNLGAARIRLRALQAATEERQPSTEVVTYAEDLDRAPRAIFTEDDRQRHTIYAPQMAPIHFRLVSAALRRLGYNI